MAPTFGTGAVSSEKMAPTFGTGAISASISPDKNGSNRNLASTFGTKPVPPHTQMHTGMQADVPCIPDSINSLTKLEAARFYHSNLKFAVHALLPPGRGDEGCRGKKPIHKGWRDHTAAEVTPEYLDRHFGPGSEYNLGAVVRAPFVHIDLDSKPDAGASVREWLSNQPHLASVPRERTGGGAHLLFICRDLPKHVAAAKKALTTSITPSVQAELYTDGMNIALSPSVPRSTKAATATSGKSPVRSPRSSGPTCATGSRSRPRTSPNAAALPRINPGGRSGTRTFAHSISPA